MFCSTCGKEIHDNAVVCIHCGCPTGKAIAPAAPATAVNDAPSFGFALLGFLFPIIGLILYLVNKDTQPLKAASAGKGAIVGVVSSVIFAIIYVIAIIAIIGGSMYY